MDEISPDEPTPPRRGVWGKGEWTLVVCIALLLLAFPASMLGWDWARAFCVYIGSAALIGAFTNRIAIHALFDPWPNRRFRLPYTGIIEIERKRIEEALMTAVSQRLVTPEILAEELRESQYLVRIRDEAIRGMREFAETWSPGEGNGHLHEEVSRAALEHTRQALDRALLNDRLLESLGTRIQAVVDEVLESEESFNLVRERFQKHSGRLGKLGHATGVADYDDMTYRIIDGIKTEMAEFWGAPERIRRLVKPWVQTAEKTLVKDPAIQQELRQFATLEAKHALTGVADRLEQWDISASPSVDTFIDYVVRRLDVRQVVGRALSKLSTEEVKQMVLKHSREHLGWLEVWGGVLGAVGGAFLWAVSPWL